MTTAHQPTQHGYLIAAADIIAAVLRTVATGFSIIGMFALLGVSWSIALALIITIGLAYCFKEYAKTESSDKEVETCDEVHLTGWHYATQAFSITVSVLCGLGLESLFLAVLVTTALTALAPISMPLCLAAISVAATLVLITLPNDVLYYWNCMRKYFAIPEKTHTHLSEAEIQRKAKFIFVYIIISNITSSLLFFGGVVSTFVTIGSFFGPIGTIIGLTLGVVAGLICAYGNYLVLCQTYKEISASFEDISKNSPMVEPFIAFNSKRREIWVRKITTWTCASASSVPIIHAFLTSAVINQHGIVAGICLSVATAIIATYTAYRFMNNYLKRVMYVKDKPTLVPAAAEPLLNEASKVEQKAALHSVPETMAKGPNCGTVLHAYKISRNKRSLIHIVTGDQQYIGSEQNVSMPSPSL